MTPLPIDPLLPAITESLRARPSLVLVAPPGAGKTTRVPPTLLRANLLPKDHPNLIMLQPRRVAARAAAGRIADENHWTLGHEVGYHIRFDRKLTRHTRLRVMTEGILTRLLLDDPLLESAGAVLLDEFHERSIHTDLAIALLREVQRARPDLLIVVMSATLEAEPVSRYLGDCPILRAEGRTFPVEITHANAPMPTSRDLPDRIAAAVADSLSPDAGDVLVFLPGVDEIRRTQSALEPLARDHNLLLLPLHGSLPPHEQLRALRPAPPGYSRKVILSTNIAETSLTIDGVRTVIDSGLARVASYDPTRGLDRLDLSRISKASATQRAGRAGRTAPGRCIRLFSAKEFAALSDFDTPEIHRVDLAPTTLTLLAWGHPDPRTFPWYDPPPEGSITNAEKLLTILGALDGPTLTDLGQRMSALPTHPRLARLLLAAANMDQLDLGATLAALLSERDLADAPRAPSYSRSPSTLSDSDFLVRLDMLAAAERSDFSPTLWDQGIDPIAARQISRTRADLLRIARHLPSSSTGPRTLNPEPLLLLPLFSHPDRLCLRRPADPSAALMVGGIGVRLAPESTVRRSDLFLALDARQDQRARAQEALVRIASAIDFAWLEHYVPHLLRRQKSLLYDESRDRVVARSTLYYIDLPLKTDDNTPVSPEEAGQVLAAALRPRAADIFRDDESAAAVLARVALLRQHMPEHPWPSFEDAQLAGILAEAAQNKRSLAELTRPGLSTLLLSALPYPLDRLLSQHAPETITVPTGNRIRLQYSLTQPPILPVRLQELFGLLDTPRVAAGRVPVLLHLLAPNFRPVQVTQDLRSFWANTYPQVRKDLRARYPKHSWPEDPTTAEPQAKGGPRRH